MKEYKLGRLGLIIGLFQHKFWQLAVKCNPNIVFHSKNYVFDSWDRPTKVNPMNNKGVNKIHKNFWLSDIGAPKNQGCYCFKVVSQRGK